MHISTALPICSACFFLLPKLFLKLQPKHPQNSSARCCARHEAFAHTGATCWKLLGKMQDVIPAFSSEQTLCQCREDAGDDPSFPLRTNSVPWYQCREDAGDDPIFPLRANSVLGHHAGKMQGMIPSFPSEQTLCQGTMQGELLLCKAAAPKPLGVHHHPHVVLPRRVLPLSGQSCWDPCCLRKPQAASKRAAVHLSLARSLFGVLPCFSKKKKWLGVETIDPET